ncbi:Dna2/Cas4 domain-containing protein [Candidatus Pacearchaeota archaeon]|nr:Dna2/Cas4 domain-containing protein [Candidatus Pacearchaeota archaeon]
MVMYSHSKISTFEQCPYKFKLRYIDKIIPEVEKTIEAHLGSAVHNTLEWLYQKAKEADSKKEIPTLDDLIIYYSDQWKKDFSQEILIVRDNMTSKDYFNKGVEFLVNYFKKHHPFDDGTIELEKKIIFSLDSDGKYEIIGFIDRLAKNAQTGDFEIHDYKTANSLPSKEKIETDRQLALYALAIKDIHGYDNEVTLNWHYLAHNKKITSKRTNEELKELRKQTLQLIKKIESANEFPANKSALCGWCEYKSMCPLFEKKVKENESAKKQGQVQESTEQQNTKSKENSEQSQKPKTEKREIKREIEINKPKTKTKPLDNKKYPTISKYLKD